MSKVKEFKNLIAASKIDEAIFFCREQISNGYGGSYYEFWLNRLTSEPKISLSDLGMPNNFYLTKSSPMPIGLIANQDTKISFPDLRPWESLNYEIPKVNKFFDREESLEDTYNAAIKKLPFNSPIYLPTERIGLKERVDGILKVLNLASEKNRAISKDKIQQLRKYFEVVGKNRIFIVGNGPSINKTDLSLLKNEITIGFNGIFLHQEFVPTIYMVEDHLVAEDRSVEIGGFNKCLVKIFPSYLGYCIEPQPNTIYLNHLPRISFPVDTDFSGEADMVTYTGGTVTYTALQLAASLGFSEIILVGVDADYKKMAVKRDATGSTGVLTSLGDDKNHFDHRYFGKGYRWHDPNVHVMMQSYRKARDFGLLNNVRFANATIGGQLNVFSRVNYYDLFSQNLVYPKVAILDFTQQDRLCATGNLKKSLFKKWDQSRLINVYSDEKNNLQAYQTIEEDIFPGNKFNLWGAFRSIIEFDPNIFYIRPTADRFSMTIFQIVTIKTMNKPWVLHYMDNWIDRLRINSDKSHGEYQAIMKELFVKSNVVLSICKNMTEYLGAAWKVQHSTPIHSYIENQKIFDSQSVNREKTHFNIAYFGGLEPDMGLATLTDFAKMAFLENEKGQYIIELSIYTSAHYRKKYSSLFEEYKFIKFKDQIVNYEDYLIELSNSDLNLIAYNFDEKSINYTKYSFSNKLAELFSCGKPFLAIGHESIATIDFLLEVEYPFVVSTSKYNLGDILNSVSKLYLTPEYEKSMRKISEELSEGRNAIKFHQLLRKVAVDRADSISLDVECLIKLLPEGINSREDYLAFIALIILPLEHINSIFERVRNHGLTWSIRSEAIELKKLIKKEFIQLLHDEKSRLIAFLISSLSHERFEEINSYTKKLLIHLLEVQKNGH